MKKSKVADRGKTKPDFPSECRQHKSRVVKIKRHYSNNEIIRESGTFLCGCTATICQSGQNWQLDEKTIWEIGQA